MIELMFDASPAEFDTFPAEMDWTLQNSADTLVDGQSTGGHRVSKTVL
jgi:hypothetical protein